MLVEAFFTKLIRCGRLTVHYADGRSDVYGGEPGPNVTIRLHYAAVGRRIARNPSLGAAESYMDGLCLSTEVTFAGLDETVERELIKTGRCSAVPGPP